MRSGSLIVAVTSLLAPLAGYATASAQVRSSVRVYEAELTIPTYEVGAPDPNPRFYTGRAYQGAQGRVYPYPMLDQLTDVRRDKTYRALYLENEYIRICVLPEIGGRVFEAVDKTNGYDFLYRQHVVKPALIGMLGVWISGGIEWNFPHHHRSRAFMPMDYTLAENPDGSKTIWLSEIELRHRMRFTIGLTVYPGRSYLEAAIKPYNRTPYLQSFLYWANVSVHAGPDYQVIFPPGTRYATYHGKNAFANWPVAREFYRGIDYRGVDISWWANHPSPISFFAWNCEDDFLAGYDHGQDAGVAYVANHHVAPGKKLWEWGPGPQGRLWDKILTDEDGPYIELMAGAYSDNQPDYSWLQPYEAKRVEQYWYPIREIGGVKAATLDAAVNLEIAADNSATIGFNATARQESARAILRIGKAIFFEEEIDIDPTSPFVKEIALPTGTRGSDLQITLISSAGEELVSYRPLDRPETPMPDAVTAPPAPEQLESVEELYLTGLRLEQFHNPALSPIPYYEEALKRDPGDSRANLALGIQHLRRGSPKKAADHFRTAIARTTKNYTSPRDGEAHYYLGLALRQQGLHEAAYDTFYKATWSHATQAAAYYQLAQLDCRRGDFTTALDHLDRSLATNAWSTSAWVLKAAVLRHLGRFVEAEELAAAVLAEEPLDLWAQNELHLARAGREARRGALDAWDALLARRLQRFGLQADAKPWHQALPWLEAQPFLEVATDYGGAGLWQEAADVLSILTDPEQERDTYPLLHYYLGYSLEKLGDAEGAALHYRRGSEMPQEYGFPFRLESIEVLRSALEMNPQDASAHYYLGNLLFDLQPQQAIEGWERARALDDRHPTLHRNLALAYVQVENDLPRAIASMEEAVARDPRDARLFYELDLLYEAGGVAAEQRLALLQENHETIVSHNDAFSREILLLTQLGRYDEAIEFMKTHHFRRWEGLGNIHTTYVDAHLLRAREHLEAGRYSDAIQDYQAALEYPENLEVAKPYGGGRECQVYYLLGEAYKAAGDAELAGELYERAATARRSPGHSALDYYQGSAYQKLGQNALAQELFAGLISYAAERVRSAGTGPSLEFFAKFGSRRSSSEQMADAYYLQGMGYLGQAERAQARQIFAEALSLNPNHLWARAELDELRQAGAP